MFKDNSALLKDSPTFIIIEATEPAGSKTQTLTGLKGRDRE